MLACNKQFAVHSASLFEACCEAAAHYPTTVVVARFPNFATYVIDSETAAFISFVI